MKRLCISLSDYVFRSYLSNIKINRSRYIEELIIKGAGVEIGELESSKQKILELIAKLRNSTDEIKTLKTEIGRLKTQLGKELPPGEIAKRRLADGIRESGIMRKYAD